MPATPCGRCSGSSPTTEAHWASAPGTLVLHELGIDVDHVVEVAARLTPVIDRLSEQFDLEKPMVHQMTDFGENLLHRRRGPVDIVVEIERAFFRQ